MNSRTSLLPPINDTLISPKPKKKPDANRFIISKETQKEFKMKDHEIPINMRMELEPGFVYKDHIDQNIKLAQKLNEVKKVIFLSKLKFNIENQIESKIKA